MKLFVYDHCPYCVRPRMIVGLKNLAVETVMLLNDDEVTPINLVGKKLVPILQKENREAMGESLDIVRYLDENYGEVLLKDEIRPELQEWCNKINSYYYRLLHPRCIAIDLEEFSTQDAIDYFVKKKSEKIGDFDKALADSEEWIKTLEDDLKILEALLLAENAAQGELSYEDIILFPMLRNLTCVKGLTFPSKVRTYIEKMAEQCQIPLFFNRQI